MVLAGDSEIVEELAPAAGQRKAKGARPASNTIGGIDKRTLLVLAGDSEIVEVLAPAARQRKAKSARPALKFSRSLHLPLDIVIKKFIRSCPLLFGTNPFIIIYRLTIAAFHHRSHPKDVRILDFSLQIRGFYRRSLLSTAELFFPCIPLLGNRTQLWRMWIQNPTIIARSMYALYLQKDLGFSQPESVSAVQLNDLHSCYFPTFIGKSIEIGNASSNRSPPKR